MHVKKIKNHLVDWKHKQIKITFNLKNLWDDGLQCITECITSDILFWEGSNLSATECILPVDLHGFCIN